MNRKGFTLTEILVVLIIIVGLAALAYPAGMRILGKAKAVHCVNNLRGIGTALTLYLSEHDNTFPKLVSARTDRESEEPAIDNTLNEYTESHDIFCCKADSEKLCETTGTSYFWNTVLNGQNAASLRFLITKDSARIPVVSDKENFHKYQGIEVNILFADGHVARDVQFSVNP